MTWIYKTTKRCSSTKRRQTITSHPTEFCSHKRQICRVEINFIYALAYDNIIHPDTWGYFSLKKIYHAENKHKIGDIERLFSLVRGSLTKKE